MTDPLYNYGRKIMHGVNYGRRMRWWQIPFFHYYFWRVKAKYRDNDRKYRP